MTQRPVSSFSSCLRARCRALFRIALLAVGLLTLAASPPQILADDTPAPIGDVDDNPDFQVEEILNGLTYPTSMAFLPDGRLLILQKNGTILIADPEDGSSATYMDISGDTAPGQELGLIDLTLDPNFQSNGYFYLYYSHAPTQKNRISRFTHQENGGGLTSTADPSSEQLVWAQPEQWDNDIHIGGGLDIGPDGKIYLTIGENNKAGQAQELTNSWGSVIRVNKDGSIPSDNPFADGPGGNVDAIWAYGLRNPFRAHWDLASNRFFVAEVGGNTQGSAYEDLHIGEAGANYGWPDCEGNCSDPSYTDPLFTYPHNGSGASITGGVVYHGNQFPSEYQGVYFYGDYVRNWMRYLTFDANGNVSGDFEFKADVGAVVAIKEAPDGSLYYLDIQQGSVHRIYYAPNVNHPPALLSIDNQNVEEGSSATVPIEANDSDNSQLTLSASNLPSFASLTDNGDGTGSLSLSPTTGDAGSYDVTISVTDGQSSDSETFTIVVTQPGVAQVLYRVNAAGSSVSAPDDGPDWSEDTNASPSSYLVTEGDLTEHDTNFSLDASVPPSTPDQIFVTERWPATGTDLAWTFPVTGGETYVVRLYFIEQWDQITGVGDRVFDATLEGQTVLDDYDIMADVGFDVGVMKDFAVTPSDGTLDLNLQKTSASPNNALIYGIEITQLGDQAPVATINSPSDGALFQAGETITFSGEATDGEDGALGGGSLEWIVEFVHNEHTHPKKGPVTGTSGSFQIPTSGHSFADDTGYKIELTAADSDGNTDVTSVQIEPDKVDLSFETNPSGLELTLAGTPEATPFVHDELIGYEQPIGAPSPQCMNGTQYVFDSWSDGGTASHTITVPSSNATYTANYVADGACQSATIVHRVNAAGGTLTAPDDGPDWGEDTNDSPSPYRLTPGDVTNHDTNFTLDASVPASTPDQIFVNERYPTGQDDMAWEFPVTAGETYEVRLYFIEQWAPNSNVGDRVFDVLMEGQTVLDDYDIIADVGFDVGVMKDFEVTPSDGTLDLDFQQESGAKTLIYGVEILKSGQTGDAQIAGTVSDYGGAPMIEGAEAALSGDAANTASTDESGAFQLSAPTGQNYALTASMNAPSGASDVNGVSTLDLALARQDILGINGLPSPYHTLAGDVNADGGLSTLDLALTRQLILDLRDGFSDVTSGQAPAGRSPLWQCAVTGLSQATYETSYSYDPLSGPQTGQDFHCFRLGDVNGSWQPPAGTQAASATASAESAGSGNAARPNASSTSGPALTLRAGEVEATASENGKPQEGASKGDASTVLVPIRAEAFDRVGGLQFTLDWDPQALSYQGVETAALTGFSPANLNAEQAEEGRLGVAWVHPEAKGQTLSEETALLTLRFRLADPLTTGEAGQRTPVEFSEELAAIGAHRVGTGAEGDGAEGDTALRPAPVQTEAGAVQVAERPEEFALQGAYPNPSPGRVTVSMDLPRAATVTVEVYDLLGRKVLTRRRSMDAGRGQTLQVDASGLTSGLYLYRVRAKTADGTQRAEGKLTLVK